MFWEIQEQETYAGADAAFTALGKKSPIFQMKLPCTHGIAAAAVAGRLGQNMMQWLAESVHPGYHLVRYAAVLAQTGWGGTGGQGDTAQEGQVGS